VILKDNSEIKGNMIGPTVYENWKASIAGESLNYSFEFPLFTDAEITGSIHLGWGPYKFF
jgi:hypothetical protein